MSSMIFAGRSATIFVEAFGQLSGLPTIDAEEEDLHSVFRERAELMGWATTSSSNDRPLLWSMEEAEITANTDPSRIGFVQVGLDVGSLKPGRASPPVGGFSYASLGLIRRTVEPAAALPALVQCFDDALRRFGVVELSGIQVTATSLDADAQSCFGYLVSVLNWFNIDLKVGADAIVTFDQSLIGSDEVSELVATLQWRNTDPFEFRTFAAVPEEYMVKIPVETPFYPVAPQSDVGVFVKLPEWTASAVGWVLASVIDVARGRTSADVSRFAVRVTRVR